MVQWLIAVERAFVRAPANVGASEVFACKKIILLLCSEKGGVCVELVGVVAI